jgi:hypothetical protein
MPEWQLPVAASAVSAEDFEDAQLGSACCAMDLQERDLSSSAQILSDMEHLLRNPPCCQSDDSRVVLHFDFLLMSDEFPVTAFALLTDPGRVLSILSEHGSGAKRILLRPYNLLPDTQLAWGGTHGSLLPILGKVVAVSAPQQRVHSRLVQCTNNFCNQQVPFTLLAQQAPHSSACSSCGGTLTENCRERVMYSEKYLGLKLQRSSNGASGLGGNLVVRLEDDLADAKVHLGQTGVHILNAVSIVGLYIANVLAHLLLRISASQTRWLPVPFP